MVSEIFVLARRRINGIVVLNYQRPPTKNRVLQEMVHRSKDARILNWFYTCGSIVGLFENVDSAVDGSCIVELFDRSSSTLNPRIHACGVILSTDMQRTQGDTVATSSGHVPPTVAISQLTNAVIVAISKENGTVSFSHNGSVTTYVGFDALLQELLSSLQSELRGTSMTDVSKTFCCFETFTHVVLVASELHRGEPSTASTS